MDIQWLFSFSKQIGQVKDKRTVPAPLANAEKPSVPVKDAVSGIENKTAEKPPAPTLPPRGRDLAVLRQQLQSLVDADSRGVDAGGDEIPPAVKAALLNLRQALDPMVPEGDAAKLAERIRGFVENSGLYYEKRLEKAIENSPGNSSEQIKPEKLTQKSGISHLMAKDVKPNLLILKQFLDESDQKAPSFQGQSLEIMKRVVSKTLAHMEQQQQSATQRPGKPELFQAFTHTMVLADDRQDARLKVYYAKKGRSKAHEKQPRISLLLDMDRIGPVRTDLWMAEGNLNITFYVQNEMAKRVVENEQKRIGAALANTFSTVSVGVVMSEKKITEFEEEALERPYLGQLDVTV